MIRIEEFIEIPKFIKKYIEIGEPGLDTITHDFCRLITEKQLEELPKGVYTLTMNEYSVKRFIDFYITKSIMDANFNCLYEEELNIPKSITNETFIVRFNGKLYEMIIDSYKDNQLNLKFI